MRSLILVTIISIVFLANERAKAQCACPLNGAKTVNGQVVPAPITTNPDNTDWPSYMPDGITPLYKNANQSNYNFKKNIFDWRGGGTDNTQITNFHLPTSNSPLPNTFKNATQVDNPFNLNLNGLPASSTIYPLTHNKDYNPSDGWELVKRYFGFDSDGHTVIQANGNYPYLILYNRFQSKLRVLVWTSPATGAQTLQVKLYFYDEVGGNVKKTGLFNTATAVALPASLDDGTYDDAFYASLSAHVPLSQADIVPSVADFDLAYDPCVCLLRTSLNVEFRLVTTANITLNGRFLGLSQGISEVVNNSQYSSFNYGDYLTSFPQSSVNVNSDGSPRVVQETNIQVNGGSVTYSGGSSDNYTNFNSDVSGDGIVSEIDKAGHDWQEYVTDLQAEEAKAEEERARIEQTTQLFETGFQVAGIATMLLRTESTDPVPGSQEQILKDYVKNYGGPKTDPVVESELSTAEKVKTGVEILQKGYEIIGKYTDKASIQVGSSARTEPNVIHGEMKLTGTATTDVPLNNLSFKIATPGSVGNSTTPSEFSSSPVTVAGKTIYPGFYPLYNEALGSFALLNAPKVSYDYVYSIPSTFNWWDHSGFGACPGGAQYCYKFENWYDMTVEEHQKVSYYKLTEDLKYVFNPAMNLNLTNSYVKAAWVIESTLGTPVGDWAAGKDPDLQGSYHAINDPVKLGPDSYLGSNIPWSLPNSVTTWNPTMTNVYTSGNTYTYMSPFVPLESFKHITPNIGSIYSSVILKNLYTSGICHDQYNQMIECTQPELRTTPVIVYDGGQPATNVVYIKLYVYMESNDLNSNGYPNSSVMILKYSPTMQREFNGSFNDNISYDYTLGTRDFTYNQTIRALNKIYVTGNITVASGSTLTLLASEGVEVSPEAVITGEVQILTDRVQVSGSPVTNYTGDMVSWCAQNRGITAPLARLGDEEESQENNIGAAQLWMTKGLEIFPNPTATNATIRYYLPTNADVNLYISDLYGNKIDNLYTNTSQVAGAYTAQLNTYSLAAGTYLCTLEQNGEKHVQRLVVVK